MNPFDDSIIEQFEVLRREGHSIYGVSKKTLEEHNIQKTKFDAIIRKCGRFILDNYSKNKDYYDSI